MVTLAALLAAVAWPVRAEVGQKTAGQAATGEVAGRVQNVSSGTYLNNARISVRGTDIIAFTDQSGRFRLAGVPAGSQTLDVFYTGLDGQAVAIDLQPGQVLERDVSLSTKDRSTADTGALKLNEFVVSTSKVTEGEDLATNEQRFAANIKNVVSTDAFGNVTEGNVAEFMKFLPGVTVDYDDAEANSVTLRGLPSNLTSITSDGTQLANANYSGSARSFQFSQVSINNVSRVEVTKVPTPSTPADSLAGSVNMISKSAFERSGAEFRYRVFLSGNGNQLTFHKTPHSFEKKTLKIFPGGDFDYTLPITKKLGIVVAGLTSSQFNDQHLSQMTFAATGTGTNSTPATPYLQTYTLFDGPKITYRSSLSLKVDWQVTQNGVLTAGVQRSLYRTYWGTDNWAFGVGSTGTSTVAGGVPMTYGPTGTVGATGRGAVTMGGGFSDLPGATTAGDLRYRFDNGTWRVRASATRSYSTSEFRQAGEGHFGGVNVTLKNPVRVTLGDITATRPGTLRAFENSGAEVNLYDINNYRITTATATASKIGDSMQTGDLGVRRRLGMLPVPAAVEIGGSYKSQERDTKKRNGTWTYNGINGDFSATPFKAVVYSGVDSAYGFQNVPWVSPHRAFQAYQANPSLFTMTPAQAVAEEQYAITNSEWIRERVTAAYAQVETRLFNNRLNVLTGVRFEQTDDDGIGPRVDPSAVFARGADGRFLHNAAGQRIRRPEAGAVGSIEELRLTRTRRGLQASRSYSGYYPSLHLTFNVTEKLQARAAYAKTYGRPDFSEIVPNATFSENDIDQGAINNPGTIPGTINMRNTALRPWSADNLDLSLEYYTERGGVLTAGVFMKDIKDFFGTEVRIATAADLQDLGLDSQYLGWQITTKFNAGDATVRGAEFNVKQSLERLGAWGRHFSGFVNGTKLQLRGDRAADFGTFLPTSMSWGLTYSRRPLTVMAKWNYRGEQKQTAVPTLGPDAYLYIKARTHLDLNVDYQLGKRFSLFANGRNVFNVPVTRYRFGSETPDYARQYRETEYGVYMSAGVKGSF